MERNCCSLHLKTNSPDKTTYMWSAGFSIDRLFKLRKHILLHIAQKTCSGEKRGSLFLNIPSLKFYMHTHIDEKLYSYDVYDSSFSQSWRLETDMWRHTAEKPYACEVCGSAFSQKSYLKSHIQLHRRINIFMWYVWFSIFNAFKLKKNLQQFEIICLWSVWFAFHWTDSKRQMQTCK